MEFTEIEFPQEDGLIYLNHAAVAPWPARTRDAIKAFAEENVHSGARDYSKWVKRESQLRLQLKQLLNAPSVQDIALVKNTSEALSVVAFGLSWQAGDNIVTSTEEFPSNRIPWQALSREGVELREVGINNSAPEQALIDAMDSRTRLLTVSSVQYGSGRRLNLELLGQACRQRQILFCVDAIQSIGAIDMDVQAIAADFVMADGHKWMLGPEGIAVLYSTAEARERLRLYQYGWHMVENTDFNVREWEVARSARRFECGSPNMLGIHGLSASISLLLEITPAVIEDKVLENTRYLIELLSTIPGMHINTPDQRACHAGIINFTIDSVDLAALQQRLLQQKVVCVYRGGGIRFSPHFYTAPDLLYKAVEIVKLSI